MVGLKLTYKDENFVLFFAFFLNSKIEKEKEKKKLKIKLAVGKVFGSNGHKIGSV